MTDTNHYLSMLRSSIMWLEKYIEVANYYSDWKQRKQTDTSPILWVNSQTPKSKILSNLSTILMLGFEGELKEKPVEFREELKQEFYKWLDTSKIDINAPVELKCALFDFHEILECRFEKTQKDRENRKREYKVGSPEYNKKMQEVFQKSQEAIQSGKVNEMDDSRFNGDPEAGKATFNAIANSLSDTERDNFHFWPQMTTEEKSEQDCQNEEQNNQIDPVLQNCRTSAIAEINAVLQESKLNNTDLSPQYQNWKNKINHTEDIIEIVNIQNLVLADIKKKKKKHSTVTSAKTLTTVLTTGIILIILSLMIILIYYYRKKNGKRK